MEPFIFSKSKYLIHSDDLNHSSDWGYSRSEHFFLQLWQFCFCGSFWSFQKVLSGHLCEGCVEAVARAPVVWSVWFITKTDESTVGPRFSREIRLSQSLMLKHRWVSRPLGVWRRKRACLGQSRPGHWWTEPWDTCQTSLRLASVLRALFGQTRTLCSTRRGQRYGTESGLG